MHGIIILQQLVELFKEVIVVDSDSQSYRIPEMDEDYDVCVITTEQYSELCSKDVKYKDIFGQLKDTKLYYTYLRK